MEIQNKICSQCKINLSIDNFYRDRTIITKISYRSKCKLCCKKNQNTRKINNKDCTITEKICNQCNINKSIDNFYKNTRCKDGYFKCCIDCQKIKVQNVGKNTKIKRTIEYMKEYNQKIYQNLVYKLKHNLRSSISGNLRKRNPTNIKNDNTIKYVGCDIDFFKKWIEYNFDENMTWENHGKYWHLDHIKPCASFDLTLQEEIYKCYNWTNYRPCEKTTNIIKSNKIDIELINDYIKIKEIYLNSIKYKIESNIYKFVSLPVDESSTVKNM